MKRVEPFAYVLPSILILALFYVTPVLINVFSSLHDVTLFQFGRDSGNFIGLQNFRVFLSSPDAWAMLWNTIFNFAFLSVVVRMVVGLAFALFLDSRVLQRLRMRGVARTLVLVPWTIPPVVAVAVWTFMLNPQFGLVNQLGQGVGLLDRGVPFLAQTSTVWAAIDTIVVWRDVGLVALLYLAALQTINPELNEAAHVDGASYWQTFRHVTWPLLLPATLLIALLQFIWTFNNFVWVWLSTGGGPGGYTEVLGTSIYRSAFIDYRIGYSAATAVVGTILVFLLALLYFWAAARARE